MDTATSNTTNYKDKKKFKINKNFILVTAIALFIVFSMVLIYVLVNKFDDVNILSVRKEYNYVFESKGDTLSIPLYIGKRNTFLSNYREIESTSISSKDCSLSSQLEAIEVGCTLFYNNDKYFEYIYHLSFDSYDDFIEPLFISDGLFNITYKNGNKLSFEIGNLCLFFNTHLIATNDMMFSKLSAVTNIVDGIETIVGLNATIRNNTNTTLHIKKISLGNMHYDFDYMHFENTSLDTACNLKSRDESYSYQQLFIDEGDMDLHIDRKSQIDIFIPIKYKKDIVYLERFPIYVDYEKDGVESNFIQDDFQFVKHANVLDYNGVKKYVYKYY